MNKIIEILEKEDNISEENKYLMYLYKNGTFVSCYNKSAFLCRYYLKDTDEKNLLKVTKCKLKDGEEYVKVGFPITSFHKYLPGIDESNLFKLDKNGDISLDVSTLFHDVLITKEKIKSWIDSFKVKNKIENTGIENTYKKEDMNNKKIELFVNILSYDYKDKTNEENILFINLLKEEAKNIISLIL